MSLIEELLEGFPENWGSRCCLAMCSLTILGGIWPSTPCVFLFPSWKQWWVTFGFLMDGSEETHAARVVARASNVLPKAGYCWGSVGTCRNWVGTWVERLCPRKIGGRGWAAHKSRLQSLFWVQFCFEASSRPLRSGWGRGPSAAIRQDLGPKFPLVHGFKWWALKWKIRSPSPFRNVC